MRSASGWNLHGSGGRRGENTQGAKTVLILECWEDGSLLDCMVSA